MTTSNTLRLLQHATSKIDELGHRISAAEERERREQHEAQLRADDARHLLSREHLLELDMAKREHQARCDAALEPWGQRAPPSVAGESVRAYQRRLLTLVQPRLPEGHRMRELDFTDPEAMPKGVLANFEPEVYRDVAAAGSRNDSAAPGELREVIRTDPRNGYKEHLFFGRESFVKQMGVPGRRVVSFWTDQGPVSASGRFLR
jgi:hypothetical protein